MTGGRGRTGLFRGAFACATIGAVYRAALSRTARNRGLAEILRARAALDDLERALVDECRRAGDSWEDIAAPLGITRQSAYRRHAGHDPLAEYLRRVREARAVTWP